MIGFLKLDIFTFSLNNFQTFRITTSFFAEIFFLSSNFLSSIFRFFARICAVITGFFVGRDWISLGLSLSTDFSIINVRSCWVDVCVDLQRKKLLLRSGGPIVQTLRKNSHFQSLGNANSGTSLLRVLLCSRNSARRQNECCEWVRMHGML